MRTPPAVQAVCDAYQSASSRSAGACSAMLVAVLTLAPAVMATITQVVQLA